MEEGIGDRGEARGERREGRRVEMGMGGRQRKEAEV